MKLSLVLALSLASGVAFAAPKETGSGKKIERSTEEAKKEKQNLENGNKVYEAAGGIAEAASTGDARSVEVASRLAELIKSEKDVLKAFDRVVEEFKLNKDEVLENCKG
jgi:hypothetical protein